MENFTFTTTTKELHAKLDWFDRNSLDESDYDADVEVIVDVEGKNKFAQFKNADGNRDQLFDAVEIAESDYLELVDMSK